MLTIWGMPIMANLEQVVLAVRVTLAGTGLLKDVRDVGTNLMGIRTPQGILQTICMKIPFCTYRADGSYPILKRCLR